MKILNECNRHNNIKDGWLEQWTNNLLLLTNSGIVSDHILSNTKYNKESPQPYHWLLPILSSLCMYFYNPFIILKNMQIIQPALCS